MLNHVLGTPINCCPECGGTIVVSYLYQYSHDYEVGKKYRLKKKCTKRDVGTMEVAIAGCKNGDCDVCWGEEDFYIDDITKFFFDCKYTKN